MNRKISILLAVLLCVSLAGCAGERTETTETAMEVSQAAETGDTTSALTADVETTAAAETAVSSAPTESFYPETMETEILLEGTPEKVTVKLFDGGNFVIYIPEGEWIHEAEL